MKLITPKEARLYIKLRKQGLSPSDADQSLAYRRKHSPTYTVTSGTYEKKFRTKSLLKAQEHARRYGGFVIEV